MSKRWKAIRVFVSAAAALSLIGCTGSTQGGGPNGDAGDHASALENRNPVVLSIASTQGPGVSTSKAFEAFAVEVTTKTEGKVEFEIY